MITLTIKTPKGEKTFQANDLPFGVLEDVVKIEEGKTNREILMALPDIIKLIFPEMKKEEIRYVGIKQFTDLISNDIASLINPVRQETKN